MDRELEGSSEWLPGDTEVLASGQGDGVKIDGGEVDPQLPRTRFEFFHQQGRMVIGSMLGLHHSASLLQTLRTQTGSGRIIPQSISQQIVQDCTRIGNTRKIGTELDCAAFGSSKLGLLITCRRNRVESGGLRSQHEKRVEAGDECDCEGGSRSKWRRTAEGGSRCVRPEEEAARRWRRNGGFAFRGREEPGLGWWWWGQARGVGLGRVSRQVGFGIDGDGVTGALSLACLSFTQDLSPRTFPQNTLTRFYEILSSQIYPSPFLFCCIRSPYLYHQLTPKFLLQFGPSI